MAIFKGYVISTSFLHIKWKKSESLCGIPNTASLPNDM